MAAAPSPEERVTALAYLDQRLRERRDAYRDLAKSARHDHSKWGYVAYLDGVVVGLEDARALALEALGLVERQKGVKKDNGS